MSKLYVYKKCISSKHNCINYIKIWKSQKSRVNKNNFEKYKDIPCGKFNHNLKYNTDKNITERQKNNKSNLALHRIKQQSSQTKYKLICTKLHERK